MHCIGQRRLSRGHVAPQCSAKGFGAAKPVKPAKQNKGTAKTAQQAADQALAEAAKSAPNVRPINPKEAAKGKVDYLQVKDWANGEAADLGELQVLPGSLSSAYSGGDAAASGPFFAQLGRHAAYLESQGATRVALGPGKKPFVPFEQWQYSLPRYMQYMADLAAVHQALEEALQLALATPQPAAAAAATHEDSASTSTKEGALLATATAALSCFACECGLWRSQAARADLAALSQLSAAQQQQQQQLSSPSGNKTASVQASQTSVAYGRYLQQLGKAAAAGAGSSSASAEEQQEACTAALKLLAHAYALHTQQQCLGTRIGAAATDTLELMSAGTVAAARGARATAVYLDYLPHVKEPLQQLVQATDAAGRLLGPEGRQAVLDELPRALTKATQVLAPLATA